MVVCILVTTMSGSDKVGIREVGATVGSALPRLFGHCPLPVGQPHRGVKRVEQPVGAGTMVPHGGMLTGRMRTIPHRSGQALRGQAQSASTAKVRVVLYMQMKGACVARMARSNSQHVLFIRGGLVTGKKHWPSSAVHAIVHRRTFGPCLCRATSECASSAGDREKQTPSARLQTNTRQTGRISCQILDGAYHGKTVVCGALTLRLRFLSSARVPRSHSNA